MDAEFGVILRLRREPGDRETMLSDASINTDIGEDVFRVVVSPGVTLVKPPKSGLFRTAVLIVALGIRRASGRGRG